MTKNTLATLDAKINQQQQLNATVYQIIADTIASLHRAQDTASKRQIGEPFNDSQEALDEALSRYLPVLEFATDHLLKIDEGLANARFLIQDEQKGAGEWK